MYVVCISNCKEEMPFKDDVHVLHAYTYIVRCRSHLQSNSALRLRFLSLAAMPEGPEAEEDLAWPEEVAAPEEAAGGGPIGTGTGVGADALQTAWLWNNVRMSFLIRRL